MKKAHFFLLVLGLFLVVSCSKETDDDADSSFDTLPACSGEFRIKKWRWDSLERHFEYDAQGRLTKATDSEDKVEIVRFEYNGIGKVAIARHYELLNGLEVYRGLDSFVYNVAGHLRQKFELKSDGSLHQAQYFSTDSKGRITSDSIPLSPGSYLFYSLEWDGSDNVNRSVFRNGPTGVLADVTYVHDDNPNPFVPLRDYFLATNSYSAFYASANNCTSAKDQSWNDYRPYGYSYFDNGLIKSRTDGNWKILYECK